MSYNVDAQVFETQIVIENTTQPAGVTSGSIINKGSLSTLDTYVTGHTVINNVKITPNLNDIIYEQQATLANNQQTYIDITDFYFDDSICNSFKALINVTVSTGDAKHAVWEINGLYKPSGWVITSSFTGDLTGVQFSMVNKEGGIGQVQYLNTNTSGTTIIRYRATTTAPPGTTPLDITSGVITNTSGPFITNNLVYANSTNTLATTDIVYNSNVLRIGGASRIVGERATDFVNFSNGGAITSMGDASVAKRMIVGQKIGIANTDPGYSLDISGDINFTGNFYKNGSLYSGSEIWTTNGTKVFYTAGNIGLGTSDPNHKLEVVGGIKSSSGLTTSSIISTSVTSGSVSSTNVIATNGTVSNALVTSLSSGSAVVSGNATFGSNVLVAGPVLQIPTGDIATRPAAPNGGYIRYNTETSQFEGYGPGNAWGSLGGVVDIAQTTKVLASANPSVTDGNLYFYTVGTERVRINSAGNVGIGTTSPGALLDVAGSLNATNVVSTNVSTATLIASTSLTATSAQITNLNVTTETVGTALATNVSATTVTAGTLLNTNAVSTNVTTATLNASTGITAASAQITNANITTLTAGTLLNTNAVSTNVTTATLNASTGITAASAQITNANITTLTAGTLLNTNVVSTNVTTATLNASTGITAASAQITNVNATNSTVTNILATAISGANMRLSGDLVIGGTLTTVNITATNISETNVSAGTVYATRVDATNSTITNAVHTSLSSGSISATNVIATNSTIGTFAALGGTIGGNVIPSADITYSLGSATNRWKDIWLASGTLYLGDKPLSLTGDTFTLEKMSVTSTVDASSVTTGALLVSGGMGVNGKIYSTQIHASSGTVGSFVSTNVTTATLNASTGITAGSAQITNLNVTTVTAATLLNTNAVSTNVSTATLVASTGITSASAQITNANVTTQTVGSALVTNLNVTTVTAATLLNTNAVSTNVSTATLVASTGITAGSSQITNLNVTTVTVATLLNTNAVSTNVSTATLVASTGITAASAQITNANVTTQTVGTALVTNLNATTVTAATLLNTNAVSTNVSTATLVASTGITAASAQITNANVTTQTVGSALVTNLNATTVTAATSRITTSLVAIGNSNTVGSIYTTGGNVGVGTVTPGYTLDVNGNGRFVNGLTIATGQPGIFTNKTITSNTNFGLIYCSDRPTIGNLGSHLFCNSNASVSYVTIDGPNYTLDVSGTGNFSDTIYGKASSFALIFGQGCAVQSLGVNNRDAGIYSWGGYGLTIAQANGFIGIGTTSPANNLDVSGTARITTSLTTGAVYATNSTMTNIVSTNFTTSSAQITNLNVTTETVGTLRATSIIGTTISAGTAAATTYTGGSMSLSGDLVIGGTITTVNITTTNVVDTNISTGTLTSTNITSTNASAATLNLSTGITSASAQITNINTTTITAATLLNTTNLVAIGSSNTIGNIFTTAGSVGIGTTSPATDNGSRLSVMGSAYDGGAGILRLYPSSYGSRAVMGFMSGQSSGSYWMLGRQNLTEFALSLSSGTAGMYFFSDGSVSCGPLTTSGLTTGTILATTSISSGAVNATNSTVTNVVATTETVGTSRITTSLLALGNSNTLGNIFTTAGNVGIGTTVPVAPLHVVGTTSATSTTAGGIFMGTFTDNNTFIQLNSTTGSYIDFSGNNNDYLARIIYTNSINALDFCTNSATVARMDSAGSLTMVGDITAFGSISDRRLKDNIVNIPLDIAFNKVKNLRPVTFTWRDTIQNKARRGTSDAGFIAQEVEEVVEYAVGEFDDIISGERYKKLNHERIIPYLVGAVQLLQQKVQDLESRLA
jgi:hypothetical protein